MIIENLNLSNSAEGDYDNYTTGLSRGNYRYYQFTVNSSAESLRGYAGMDRLSIKPICIKKFS